MLVDKMADVTKNIRIYYNAGRWNVGKVFKRWSDDLVSEAIECG